NNSKEIIVELISKNIFIEFSTIRDTDSGKATNTYSYHKLFKEFLATTLHKIRTEDEVNLAVKKIYTYYKESGNTEAAIGFSLFAKDYATAIELIENSFTGFFDDSRFETLWKWLDSIPAELKDKDPELLYYLGLMMRYYKSDNN